jgi:uncharacterized protein (DUF1697 family)
VGVLAVPVYAALLRGINVGGRTRVSMADLRELFDELGATDVQTYVQSGNVVFASSERSAAKLEHAVEKQIKKALGLDVRVLVRTAAQLAKVAKANPFLKAKKDEAALHVTFLKEKPAAAKVKAIDPEVGGADEFRVASREIYLHFPNGYGRTKLNNTFFEKKLAVPATTRNWRTVTKLVDLARG